MSPSAYFIAKKKQDGSPGKPIGNEVGAIMVFEELEVARGTCEVLSREHGQLSIFAMNIVVVGEVPWV